MQNDQRPHDGTSPTVGLSDRLRERAPIAVDWSQDIVFCTSLAGRELSRFSGVFGLASEGERFPEVGQQAPQYVLEELLREVADEQPNTRLALGWSVSVSHTGDARQSCVWSIMSATSMW